MFFDIHVHAYRPGCPPVDGRTRFATLSDVLRRYDELGIERGCLLPLIGPEVYLPQSNEEILDLCVQSGGRLIPACNIDSRGMTNDATAPLGLWLDHYRERGCRLLGEVMPNLPFLDPRSQNLFAAAAAAGLPLTFDMAHRLCGGYGFYDDAGLPQLDETLRRHPTLRIFGHGPPFWAEVGILERAKNRAGYPSYAVRGEGATVRLFRRHRNLFGDLSAQSGYNALARDRAFAIHFLNEFQDRLMFGTDLCAPDQPIRLAGLLLEMRERGEISDMVFQKIARLNALRLLGLETTGGRHA